MNTKERGDIAVGFAISHYINSGYEICLPIGDKRCYDFVIEKEGKLLRVQIKWAGLYKKNNRCCVALRTMGGNQSYNYARYYKKEDFDVLFVHTERGENYSIPWVEVLPRNELTIEDPKYKKYRV